MKVLVLSLTVFLTTPLALAGHEVGNGGDAIVAEFLEIAEKFVKEFREVPPANLPFDLNVFAKAVDGCRNDDKKMESTTEDLVLNGVRKDAINYPSTGRIVIQRLRWLSLPYYLKRRLVLHEFLWLIGVDDGDYRISSSLIDSAYRLQSGKVDVALIARAQDLLKTAYQAGLQMKSATLEVEVLLNALKDVGELVLETQSLLRLTVFGAIQDIAEKDVSTSTRAALLRRFVRFALEDLEIMATNRVSHMEHKSLLSRADSIAWLAQTKALEISIRSKSVYRAVELADLNSDDTSDYQRKLRQSAGLVYKIVNDSNKTEEYKLQRLRTVMRDLLAL